MPASGAGTGRTPMRRPGRSSGSRQGPSAGGSRLTEGAGIWSMGSDVDQPLRKAMTDAAPTVGRTTGPTAGAVAGAPASVGPTTGGPADVRPASGAPTDDGPLDAAAFAAESCQATDRPGPAAG